MSFWSGIRNMFGRGDRAATGFILSGRTDWHSHILPGIDDGAESMEQSLHLLEELGRRGVSSVWLTPHIMEDYPNTTEELRAIFGELRNNYDGPVQLHLASENMLDTLFAERLAANDFLPIGPGRDMLLVETSYYSPPTGLEERLFEIRSAGLIPLLAHPERYTYMDMEQYRRLAAQGVRFQLNMMSLLGHYGPDAKAKARLLMKEGHYYCVGSDIHHAAHLPILDRLSPSIAKELPQ